jgi:hypothetical protein
LPTSDYYTAPLKAFFPNADIVPIPSPRSYFRDEVKDLDAVAYSVEVGSTWTLLYPEFAVVAPRGLRLKSPVGFALPLHGGRNLKLFVDTWLSLKSDTGFDQQLYDYWILGESAVAKGPRWSVIRDVLHWVE